MTGWAATAWATGPEAGTLTIGEITIETRDIFGAEELHSDGEPVRWLHRTMNTVHVNTRHHVLKQELLFGRGDRFDAQKLAETERNLRALGYLNDIRVTATDTTADGRVNVLVSARESWTLNTAFAYTRASDGGQRWSASISDGNVLGGGFLLGAGVGENEVGSFTHLWFSKRRPFGTAWHVSAYYDEPSGGHRRGFVLGRPFYSQDDRWGLTFRAWDYTDNYRYFLSNASAAGSDPAREASLYAEILRSQTGGEVSFRVRLGAVGAAPSDRIWRVGAGLRWTDSTHHVDLQPAWWLSDGTARNLDYLLDSGSPLEREQGLWVFPYLHVETMGRRWIKRRFVNNYGPVEDLRLAWSGSLRVGFGGDAAGATAGASGNFLRAEAVVHRYFPLGGGLLRIQGAGDVQAGVRDQRTHQVALLSSWTRTRGEELRPWITRATVEWAQAYRPAPYDVYLLGLDRGIRTLEFDGMAGDRLARWNLEQGKVLPWVPLGLFRMGGAMFYSGGCAWFSDEQRDLGDARHELGFGLRVGPVRSSNAQVTRIDLTWNTGDFGSGPVLTTITRGTF